MINQRRRLALLTVYLMCCSHSVQAQSSVENSLLGSAWLGVWQWLGVWILVGAGLFIFWANKHSLANIFSMSAPKDLPQTTTRQALPAEINEDASYDQEEAEEYFRAVFDQSPYPIFITDLKGNIRSINLAAQRLSGYDVVTMTSFNFAKFCHPDDISQVSEAFIKTQAGETVEFITRGINARGDVVAVKVTTVPVVVRDTVRGVTAIVEDVTKLRTAEEKVLLSARALANIAEAAMIMEEDYRVVTTNKAFTEITGYAESEITGSLPFHIAADLQISTHREALIDEIKAILISGKYWKGELQIRRKNDECFPSLMTVSAVLNDTQEITHYVAIFNDLSQNRHFEHRLEHLANYDALTDLPNRTKLQEQMESALARAQRRNSMLALLILDLDQFKAINDSLGHKIGDQMIKLLGQRLRTMIREVDTLARLGGDEFAILIEDAESINDAARVAEKILEALKQPFAFDNYELFTTVSIGIACTPNDGVDTAALMRSADSAMYQAKRDGRNIYRFFSTEINAQTHEYLLLANNLRYAMKRNELSLHYQPCINLQTGRIQGMEALLRWNHPIFGMVSPVTFIPVAESTGLINGIGEWVLITACKQAKAWIDKGYPPMRMAVNLSPRQFRDNNLCHIIQQALDKTGLEPRYLELEITEGVLMENPARVKTLLADLGKLGITFAIDDFGTGYSSLGYLKEFRVHILKIDRSFIKDLPGDPDQASITQTIVAMAKNLHLSVIAEGVETESQGQFLREIGCDEGQGYFYGRPVPAAELAGMLENQLKSQPDKNESC